MLDYFVYFVNKTIKILIKNLEVGKVYFELINF